MIPFAWAVPTAETTARRRCAASARGRLFTSARRCRPGFSPQKRHHQDRRAVLQLEEIEDVDHVGMLHRAGHAGLSQQAHAHGGPQVRGHRRVQELHCHRARRGELHRLPHLPHATFAQQPDQAVAAAEHRVGRNGHALGGGPAPVPAAQRGRPGDTAVYLHRTPHRLQQLRGRHRLGEVAQCAVLHGFHRGVDGRIPRHEDHRDLDLALAKQLQQVDPHKPGHVDVAEDHVERLLPDQLGRRRPVPALGDGVARGPELPRNHVE